MTDFDFKETKADVVFHFAAGLPTIINKRPIDLYSTYVAYCEQKNSAPMSLPDFGRHMGKTGLFEKSIKSRRRGSQRRYSTITDGNVQGITIGPDLRRDMVVAYLMHCPVTRPIDSKAIYSSFTDWCASKGLPVLSKRALAVGLMRSGKISRSAKWAKNDNGRMSQVSIYSPIGMTNKKTTRPLIEVRIEVWERFRMCSLVQKQSVTEALGEALKSYCDRADPRTRGEGSGTL